MTKRKTGVEYWFQQAQPGESFVYYTGCGFKADGGKPAERHCDKPEDAKLAWQLAIAGVATLTQKRIGPFRFEYIITKGKFEPLDRALPIRGCRLKGDGTIVEAVETPPEARHAAA